MIIFTSLPSFPMLYILHDIWTSLIHHLHVMFLCHIFKVTYKVLSAYLLFFVHQVGFFQLLYFTPSPLIFVLKIKWWIHVLSSYKIDILSNWLGTNRLNPPFPVTPFMCLSFTTDEPQVSCELSTFIFIFWYCQNWYFNVLKSFDVIATLHPLSHPQIIPCLLSPNPLSLTYNSPDHLPPNLDQSFVLCFI